MKIKLINLFFGIALALLLSSIGHWYLTTEFEAKRQMLLSDRAKIADIQHDVLTRGYKQFSTFIFDTLINKEFVSEIMKKAASASASEQAILRQELLKKLSPAYARMKKEHIRQLHFHLPQAKTFLRFHKPSKFGDDLSKIRYSIVQVQKTKKMVVGFEEGRMFNGIRHVYPLFFKGEFVGSVEISYNFFAFMSSSVHEAGELFYHAVLRKNILDEKRWMSERSHYAISKLDERYVYDMDMYNIRLASSSFDIEKEGHILARIAPLFKKAISLSKASTQSILFEGDYYSVVLNPIYNVKKEQVAYFITINKDSQLAVLSRSYADLMGVMYSASVIIALLVTLLLSILYLRIFGLKHMAQVDYLTQVANRAYSYKKMRDMSAICKKYRTEFSLVFFDIDHFKDVNDTFGHDMGDEILKTLSKLVQENLRKGDLLGRWGGEEFMILLAHTNLKSAVLLAEKLRKIIAEYNFEHGKLTCSFGVVAADGNSDLPELIKEADLLLYKAKAQGRNVVVSENVDT